MFELGFIQPNPTSQNGFYYLSIRYTESDKNIIVWTANREKPLANSFGVKLEIASNGNLELYDIHTSINSLWSTSLTGSPVSPEMVAAVLGDDGNLILTDGDTIFWQSFDNPTNTWLPGAIIRSGQQLVSWKSDDNPAPGPFSAELVSEDGASQIVLKWDGSTEYWQSGHVDSYGQFKFAPLLSKSFSFEVPENRSYLRFFNMIVALNGSDVSMHVFSMLVMDHRFGALKQIMSRWGSSSRSLVSTLVTEGFVPCGANGYGISSSSSCACLQGFLKLDDSTCSRKSPLECGSKNSYYFVEISEMKLPDEAILFATQKEEEECELACRERCSCTAYAVNQSGCFIWEGDLFGLRKQISNQQKLHLKLANPYPSKAKGKTKALEVIIAVVVTVIVLVSGASLGFFYNRRTKHKENKEPGVDLLSFDFNHGFNSTDYGSVSRTTRSNTEFDLPMFSYASVSAATNNFSPQNKLGEGGFGPVYKGTLLNGQEIALKRLSQKSGQGFEEFRNEILSIAKLQHVNLVRLLGCCIDPNESILIYEYMSNKSLDFFIFGSEKQDTLDWETRVRIVEGIAQGILYLHEYSRVHIVHRDLKASNILLDDEMNPKISDFGMARIFGGTDSRAHTNKVVGTFGYIAPEYALEGIFSTKSDVYSFGVLVLEIISGRKNTGFYKTDSLSLLGHAWNLWISDRGVELVDDKVRSPAALTALRYINVGLLCVQENPNDRPTMSSVVSMLSSEIAALPPPKKPAFSTESLISSKFSVKNSAGKPDPSINGLTVSVIEPR
ncbi:hypothetical protein C2S53_011791 [Perilla frutescens var. hirtella]|uniref:Receptor-like serine/threonine-protein kinase n=1 Tax=Perilla frutescens var. hirtella TaxID=608512 RepID=A0AAD4IZC7_PERFH|nr:hypothetical protein C2S53_011791 [Perilla frutescens var. hirtella]